MKRYNILTLVAASFISFTTAFASPNFSSTNTNCPNCLATNETESTTNWSKFTKGVQAGLVHDNQGVRESALQQIIGYGDKLTLDRTDIFEIVKIYRNSKHENQRILALAALHATKDAWAMDFLARSVKTESSAHVANLTNAVLSESK